MTTYARTLQLRDDASAIEAYRQYHTAVWPEVLAALRSVGIERMRIWLHGRRLFMLMETTDAFDPDRDLARYQRSPRVADWEALMQTMQEPLEGSPAGEWWVDMELVFVL